MALFRKPVFWLALALFLGALALIYFPAERFAFPAEATAAIITQNGGAALDTAVLEDAALVELAAALSGGRKTGRASVHDAPQAASYYTVDILSGDTRHRAYFYQERGAFFLEFPYGDVYSWLSSAGEAIDKLFADAIANSRAEAGEKPLLYTVDGEHPRNLDVGKAGFARWIEGFLQADTPKEQTILTYEIREISQITLNFAKPGEKGHFRLRVVYNIQTADGYASEADGIQGAGDWWNLCREFTVQKRAAGLYAVLDLRPAKAEQPVALKLPDFVYEGDDAVLGLVYGQNLKRHLGKEDGHFAVPAVQVVYTVEEGDRLKVFFRVIIMKYRLLAGGYVQDLGGSGYSAAMTFRRQDGAYALEIFHEPGDGKVYVTDIRAFCVTPSGAAIPGLADRLLLGTTEERERLSQTQRENLLAHLKKYGKTGLVLKALGGQEVLLR